MASWPASTRNARAPGIASNSWIWRRSGTTSSCIVTTTDVGTSISPSQSPERKSPIAPPASRIIRQSWDAASSTAHGDHVAVLRSRYSWFDSHDRACAGVRRARRPEAAQPEERQAVVVAGLEAGGRRRQHESPHDVRVAPPDELGDGATHRVADDDGGAVALGAQQLGDVVGAVLEPEAAARPDAAAVAAVVEREHAEVLAERLEARPEVEVGRRGPAVQQDDRRRTGRSGDLAQADRSGGQLDLAGRREPWRAGCGRVDEQVVERRQLGVRRDRPLVGQAAVTSRMRTRSSAPVGVS